jgi:glycosyltransferase involved in cell wall biosynthesis
MVLATGISPPDLGGPAPAAANRARERARGGHRVAVVTYGAPRQAPGEYAVRAVAKEGGPLLRWRRYAAALRDEAADADVVEAFSSVSAGIPTVFARLRRPKLVLRLGGDFPWERATDRGYPRSLRAWFAEMPPSARLIAPILRRFDHLVFSTEYQRELYRQAYAGLPASSVIENALPEPVAAAPHALRRPARLLSFGRFVAFKNLPVLVRALRDLPDCTLTFVGEGPAEGSIRQALAAHPDTASRVSFRPPAHGEEKARVFAEHDLLVVPSLTDISPNAALEARSAGLPVLLTRETGLSERLTAGMRLAEMGAPAAVADAIRRALAEYADLAAAAARPPLKRDWDAVAAEHLALFSRLA